MATRRTTAATGLPASIEAAWGLRDTAQQGAANPG